MKPTEKTGNEIFSCFSSRNENRRWDPPQPIRSKRQADNVGPQNTGLNTSELGPRGALAWWTRILWHVGNRETSDLMWTAQLTMGRDTIGQAFRSGNLWNVFKSVCHVEHSGVAWARPLTASYWGTKSVNGGSAHVCKWAQGMEKNIICPHYHTVPCSPTLIHSEMVTPHLEVSNLRGNNQMMWNFAN